MAAGSAIAIAELGVIVLLLTLARARYWVADQVVWQAFNILVMTAIREEVFYRGFMFTIMRKRYSFLIAALVSSAIFGCSHLASAMSAVQQEQGWLAASAQIVAPALQGLANCWMLERGGGSLWGPILGHFGWDAANASIAREDPAVGSLLVDHFWLVKVVLDVAVTVGFALIFFPPFSKATKRGKSAR